MKVEREKNIHLSIRLLRWFCKPYYLEIIEGDLLEIYHRQRQFNTRKAGRHLWWNTIRFFRFRYIKNIEDLKPQSSIGMYKNYFKVALRNMRKSLGYTLFNVLGLAIGICSVLLITLHVSFQFTYDKHITHADRIYKVVNEYSPDLERFGRTTPALLVSKLKEDYPEVETGVRTTGIFPIIFELDNEYFSERGCIMVDSTFFDVFPATFLAGTPENALNRENTIVLTQSMAQKLFPDQNPVGEILKNNDTNYEVTAVITDPPKSTSIPYRYLLSLPHDEWATKGWWSANNFNSYIKLKEGVDVEQLKAKMPDFVTRYLADELLDFLSKYEDWDSYLADGNHKSFGFKPLLDIHLHYPSLTMGNPGSYNNVITFSIIAFFILLIACINYINMSTAKSSLRAKEVGMRKVMGSIRRGLIYQFLVESVTITIIAMIVGLILSLLVLPYFNYITGMEYELGFLFQLNSLIWIILILLIVGILAGSYPAFYISSFKPVSALKGENVQGGSKKLRSSLVVFQFAISIFLITGTLLVYMQIDHVSKRELGLNVEQTFVIKTLGKLDKNYEAFSNKLLSNPSVGSIGMMSSYPSGSISDWGYNTRGDNKVSLNPDHFFVDENVLQTLGIELSTGRYFTGQESDFKSVLVNETFVKNAGWDQPIGQVLDRGSESDRYQVVGVTKDFVSRTGSRNIRSQLFRYSDKIHEGYHGNYNSYCHVSINGDYQETIQFIEETWDSFVPGYPFDGFFLDEAFNRLYIDERKFGQLFTSFSILAIVIASIGLFSLAAFTLEKRTKEIAIRKVLGATEIKVISIVLLDFLKLIIIGSVLSIPVVYYLGGEWLSNYDYRISIQPFIFFIPILAVILISILTIGYKSYIAATSNPAFALKQE